MRKRLVDIDFGDVTETIEVPDDIQTDKVPQWIEWMKINRRWEKYDNTFITSTGKTIKLPCRNYKAVMKQLPEKEAQEFNEARLRANELLMKRMQAKRMCYGNCGQKKLKQLEDKWSSYVLELLGKDYSCAEVHRKLVSQGAQLDYCWVLQFAKRNEEKVRELRNTFREDYQDVSISIKRSRLEKLNFLLNDLLQEYETASVSTKLNYAREIRSILDQARKEVEGEELKLTVTGRIDVEATISNYMNDSKLLQGLTIQQLVISRVAARLGVHPQVLLYRLAHGFYSKWNGFRRNDDLSTKPIYPSSVNYDILDLETKNKQWNEKNKDREEYEDAVIVGEELTKAVTGKQALRNKIEALLKANKESQAQVKKQ